jgi:bacillithiol system protein YtxJ
MIWISLDSQEKISEIKDISENQRVLLFIFKPGTSVDFIVKTLLEREWNESEIKMKTYLADIGENKKLSEDIEKEFGAGKETPQALILESGKTVFKAFNGRILFSEIKRFSN